MALRDRLNRTAATAIPAIPAILEPSGRDEPARIARIATIAEVEREIRQHLKRLLPGEDHADFPEALALALRDPAAALSAFRSTKGAA